jgi:hypothetical protein
MKGKIKEILEVERLLAGLEERKDAFKANPRHFAFYTAEYEKLKLKREALMNNLSAAEKVKIAEAIKRIREHPNTASIGGSKMDVGPIAGATASGRPYAFIPTGPVIEIRMRKDGKIAR